MKLRFRWHMPSIPNNKRAFDTSSRIYWSFWSCLECMYVDKISFTGTLLKNEYILPLCHIERDRYCHLFLTPGKGYKKSGNFPKWGGEGLPIWAPFPSFFNLFLNMVWIIQKCKTNLFTPWWPLKLGVGPLNFSHFPETGENKFSSH